MPCRKRKRILELSVDPAVEESKVIEGVERAMEAEGLTRKDTVGLLMK